MDATLIIKVILQLNANKVKHWEYTLQVMEITEPENTEAITHIKGIISAYSNTAEMIDRVSQ
jgi:hypothetical protein